MKYYLVVPKKELKSYTHEEHRNYFAKPIEVVPEYCDLKTRLWYVHEPCHNCRYPVQPEMLKTEYSLTNKQREAASHATT